MNVLILQTRFIFAYDMDAPVTHADFVKVIGD